MLNLVQNAPYCVIARQYKIDTQWPMANAKTCGCCFDILITFPVNSDALDENNEISDDCMCPLYKLLRYKFNLSRVKYYLNCTAALITGGIKWIPTVNRLPARSSILFVERQVNKAVDCIFQN